VIYKIYIVITEIDECFVNSNNRYSINAHYINCNGKFQSNFYNLLANLLKIFKTSLRFSSFQG